MSAGRGCLPQRVHPDEARVGSRPASFLRYSNAGDVERSQAARNIRLHYDRSNCGLSQPGGAASGRSRPEADLTSADSDPLGGSCRDLLPWTPIPGELLLRVNTALAARSEYLREHSSVGPDRAGLPGSSEAARDHDRKPRPDIRQRVTQHRVRRARGRIVSLQREHQRAERGRGSREGERNLPLDFAAIAG